MIAFSLSVLALAAGVYLLIKVKREYMSGLFAALSWLVIVLALASMATLGFRTYQRMHHCSDKSCNMEKEVKVTTNGTCGHHGMKGGCCMMNDSMPGCRWEGDSMVMDKAACEKMMGKEACDAMMKDRGRCIMSKEECKQMNHCSGSGTGSHMGAAACQGDCTGKCTGTCTGNCPKGKANCCKQ